MAVEDVVTTPFGLFLVTKGELIGETTRAGTLWDGPGFLQVIAKEHGRLGERGTTILDVGANQGAFSIWLAGQGAWRVIAVEPVPEVMQRLKANLDLNKAITADVILPLQIAAYDRVIQFSRPPLDPGNWGGTALTPDASQARSILGVPLDQFSWAFGERVSLIKVDAQGCDLRALEGLKHTILRDHPVIVFEWEAELAKAHGQSLHAVTLWLQGLGYQVHEWPTHKNNYLALPRKEQL